MDFEMNFDMLKTIMTRGQDGIPKQTIIKFIDDCKDKGMTVGETLEEIKTSFVGD